LLTFRDATFVQRRFLSLEPLLGPLPSLDLASIDWVIVGGESGPDFRPLDLGWVRDLRDRCVSMRIPLFFKQIGRDDQRSSDTRLASAALRWFGRSVGAWDPA
jgi:protein gp37